MAGGEVYAREARLYQSKKNGRINKGVKNIGLQQPETDADQRQFKNNQMNQYASDEYSGSMNQSADHEADHLGKNNAFDI